jgi:hypothetical protein
LRTGWDRRNFGPHFPGMTEDELFAFLDRRLAELENRLTAAGVADRAAYRAELNDMQATLQSWIQEQVRAPEPKPTQPQPELIRAMQAREVLGGRGVLDRVMRARWLTPVSQNKRLTLFQRREVEAVAYRISIEGLP